MNDIELYNPECRICFDEVDEDELISPCRCKGTSKWIHRGCLNKWRTITIGREANEKCMECREEYIIRRINQPENTRLFLYPKLFIVYNFFVAMLFGIIWTLLNDYTRHPSLLLYLLNGGEEEPTAEICEYTRNDSNVQYNLYVCKNTTTIFDQMRLPQGYYVNVIFHVYFLLSLNSIMFTLFYYNLICKKIIRRKLYCTLHKCYLLYWNLYIFRFFILYYLASRVFFEPNFFFGIANINIFIEFACYYDFFKRHKIIIRNINNTFLEEEYVLNWSENPINEFEFTEFEIPEFEIPEIGITNNINISDEEEDSEDN
tara:strand:+ start:463 stop:1410 length:948 start_codon:yes stop_codon:yes gene_type:complete